MACNTLQLSFSKVLLFWKKLWSWKDHAGVKLETCLLLHGPQPIGLGWSAGNLVVLVCWGVADSSDSCSFCNFCSPEERHNQNLEPPAGLVDWGTAFGWMSYSCAVNNTLEERNQAKEVLYVKHTYKLSTVSPWLVYQFLFLFSESELKELAASLSAFPSQVSAWPSNSSRERTMSSMRSSPCCVVVFCGVCWTDAKPFIEQLVAPLGVL